jgi:hypothetical protein
MLLQVCGSTQIFKVEYLYTHATSSDEKTREPLKRTGRIFGGLWDDIRLRSEIKDGLNAQCFAALFFIYCACIVPAITIGSLLSAVLRNVYIQGDCIVVALQVRKLMAGWVSLLGVSIFGVIFALFPDSRSSYLERQDQN